MNDNDRLTYNSDIHKPTGLLSEAFNKKFPPANHDKPATEPVVDTDCACSVCVCDMGHVNDGVCRDCRNSDHSGELRKPATEPDVPSHDGEFDHKAQPIRHAGEIVCAKCGTVLPDENGGG